MSEIKKKELNEKPNDGEKKKKRNRLLGILNKNMNQLSKKESSESPVSMIKFFKYLFNNF